MLWLYECVVFQYGFHTAQVTTFFSPLSVAVAAQRVL